MSNLETHNSNGPLLQGHTPKASNGRPSSNFSPTQIISSCPSAPVHSTKSKRRRVPRDWRGLFSFMPNGVAITLSEHNGPREAPVAALPREDITRKRRVARKAAADEPPSRTHRDARPKTRDMQTLIITLIVHKQAASGFLRPCRRGDAYSDYTAVMTEPPATQPVIEC
jgi:hypothetical protein